MLAGEGSRECKRCISEINADFAAVKEVDQQLNLKSLVAL